MYVQRSTPVGPQVGAQSVGFPDSSGGTSPGAGDRLRVDWKLRMNVVHHSGFVGGVGRVLIHNEDDAEQTELTLYLPGADPSKQGVSLKLLSATLVSAKPGIPATQGQQMVIQPTGMKAVVAIPVLRHGDWIYVDLTWSGAFPIDGKPWNQGAVPLGLFHPQIAVEVRQPGAHDAIKPLPARYEVELGADPGTTVMLDGEGRVVTHPGDDGDSVQHDFRSYGTPHIQARLAAPGVIVGPPPSA